MDGMADPAPVGLAEMIRELRAELMNAQEEGGNTSLRFEVGEVELELEVEVARGVEGSAGVKFWVASAGSAGSVSSTRTQRMRILLQPVNAHGERPRISRQGRPGG